MICRTRRKGRRKIKRETERKFKKREIYSKKNIISVKNDKAKKVQRPGPLLPFI